MHECEMHQLPAFGYPHGCYGCLKSRFLAGLTLTAEELEFIGVVEEPPPRVNGWVEPATVGSPDTTILKRLMTAAQIEFLA